MEKAKIGVLVDQLIPGGVQKTAIEEVRGLRRLGHDAKLVILMREGFSQKNRYLVSNTPYFFLTDRFPKILRLNIKFPVFRFLSLNHLLSPILAPFTVPTKEFDCILSHGTTTSFTAWSLSCFRGIPYIFAVHDPMAYILEKIYRPTYLSLFFPIIKPLVSFLQKHLVRKAAFCVLDSNVHKNLIAEKYMAKTQVLRLSVTPQKLPKKRGDKIICFGRWDKGKGLEVLTKLLKKLPGQKMVIAGTWSNQDELMWFKTMLQTNRLTDQIDLITGYNNQDLANICMQGRLWLHPHFEGFSLSALEAASFGLPIIIPKNSGVTELFQDGVHGYFPSRVTAGQLQKTILPLLKDERLAYKMGVKAANAVKQKCGPSNRINTLCSLMQAATGPTPRLTALELGHIGEKGLAGGDILLIEMLKRLKNPPEVTVLLPKTSTHWKDYGQKARLIGISSTLLDKCLNPFAIFLTYVIRVIKATLILATTSKKTILYSSTHLFPDIIPAFFDKLLHPNKYWIARIHHLSPAPDKRPGNIMINLGAHILQLMTFQAIRTKADIIFVLNHSLRNQLIHMGFSTPKLTVLGGGVDFNNIQKFQPLKTAGYEAIFLGRLHPAKGIFDLPLIWQQVTAALPDARLAVIGPGSEFMKNKLRLEIKKQNLLQNIDILGFLPQKKVISILKRAKLFLFTDHEAGFGLAVAEAMACGLPVVGYDNGVLGNVYEGGFQKIAVGDYKSFSEAVLNLLKDDKLRQHFSKQALSEAQKLDWSKTASKFQSLLSELF